tara:strand:+ start:471 stop:572 length:102 start_codon:yes stop_codon:yes gene_type:complete
MFLGLLCFAMFWDFFFGTNILGTYDAMLNGGIK